MSDQFDEQLSAYAQREMREAMGLQHWPWVTRLVNSVVLEAQRLRRETSERVEVADAMYRLTDQLLAFAGRVIVDAGPSDQFEEGRRLALADIETISAALGLRPVFESVPPEPVEDLTVVWDGNRSGEKVATTYFKAPHPLAKWHVWSRSGDTAPSYAMVTICGAGIGVTRDAPTLEVMRSDEVPSKLCAKCAKVLARLS